MRISGVVITYNEEKCIARCIQSMQGVVDEVVVLDSLSTDRTVEICKSLGARVYQQPFKDFVHQKNDAIALANNDIILLLDADEALSAKLHENIRRFKAKGVMEFDGYRIRRLNRFFGKWIKHTSIYPDRKVRLFDRTKGRFEGSIVHEEFELYPGGRLGYLEGDILHWLASRFEKLVDTTNKYSSLSAQAYHLRGRKTSFAGLLFHPFWHFFRSYVIKLGFLNGVEGYIISMNNAVSCYYKYAKLRYIDFQDNEDGKLLPGQPSTGHSPDSPEEKPLRIGFDAKRFFFNRSGLGNYSRNLVKALAASYPENQYVLFTPSDKEIGTNDCFEFEVVTPGNGLYRTLSSLWRTRFICSSIKKSRVELYHGLSHELPIGINRTGVKSVLTVHDLIFIRFPEFYKKIDAYIYRKKLEYACRVATHIVAISEQTRQDLVTYLKIDPQKISVIYQGCNPVFWQDYSAESLQVVRAKYNLPDRYILSVGTIEERKNLLSVIKAMHQANIGIPLVAVGRKTNYYHNHVLPYIQQNGLQNIVFIEGIDNVELPAIYRGAECLVYPSLFEGFGIPLVEALVSGVPVITSHDGCFREAAGPGSLYVDPHSPGDIARAISMVLNDPDLKSKMVEAGREYAKRFEASHVAQQYMYLYKSLT
jgi:glycosyltransferase involved in cell wall biosynthesis